MRKTMKAANHTEKAHGLVRTTRLLPDWLTLRFPRLENDCSGTCPERRAMGEEGRAGPGELQASELLQHERAARTELGKARRLLVDGFVLVCLLVTLDSALAQRTKWDTTFALSAGCKSK